MSDKSWDPVPALEGERLRTQERLAGLVGDHAGIVAASLDSNADDEHDPEGATIAFERSQVAALLGQARRQLGEVDDALARVSAGGYGVCAACSRPIPAARLHARPTARHCITCAAVQP